MKKTFTVLIVILIVAILIIAAISINFSDQRKKGNNAPMAIIDSPKNGDIFSIEDEIVFDGSSSSDPEEEILFYAWSSNLSGDFGYDGILNHKLDAGVHEIMLTVTDNKGKENFTIIRILVYPLPNIIIDSPLFNSEYYSTELIFFNGSNCSSQYSSNVNFTWISDLDGILGHSMILSTNLSIGYHTITLEVDDGLSTSQEQIMLEIIENHAPTAAIKSPKYNDLFQVTEEVLFDGTDCTDPDDQVLYYNWTSNIDGLIGTEKHFYKSLSAATHIITLEINDGYGCYSDTLTVITINTPPVAIAGEDLLVELGEKVLFDGSNSTDNDGDVLFYHWDFGNGEEKYGEKLFHTYNVEGIYNVTLTVDDGKNGIDEDNLEIEVIYIFRGPGVCGYIFNNETKKPIKNINISAFNWETYYLNSTTTNESGYYEMHTPEGFIDLFINSYRYYSFYENISVGKNQVVEKDIYLIPIPPETSKVFGYVYDAETNEPLSGAEVELENDGDYYNYTYTDYDGYYEMNAPAGEFWLWCYYWDWNVDYEYYETEFILDKDESLELDIYLRHEKPTVYNETYEFDPNDWELLTYTLRITQNSYTEDLRYEIDQNEDGTVSEAEVTAYELMMEAEYEIYYSDFSTNETFMVDNISFEYVRNTMDIEIEDAVGPTTSIAPINLSFSMELSSAESIPLSDTHNITIEIEYDTSDYTYIYFIKLPTNFEMINYSTYFNESNISVNGKNLIIVDPGSDWWYYWDQVIIEVKKSN